MSSKIDRTTAFAGLLFFAFLLVWVQFPAFAKTDIKGVRDSVPDAYRPVGGRFGSLIVEPAIEILQKYDDNIFKQATSQKTDHILSVKPKMLVTTDWNLHRLQAGVAANYARYRRTHSEDYKDVSIFLSGRYDVDYETYFNAGVNYDRKHEERGSVDDVDGDEPLIYDIRSANIGFTRELGLLNLYLSNTYRQISYQDSTLSGSKVDNGERNRWHNAARLKLGYDLSDDSEIYATIQHDRKRYERNSVSFRNADGMDYRIGLSSVLTGKVQADIFAGYISQKYQGEDFRDTKSVRFGGAMLWNLTGLTTLKAELDRSLIETVQIGASAVMRTKGMVYVDHALRPNVLIGLSGGILEDSYQGDNAVNAGRDNTIYKVGFNLDYLFTPAWAAKFSYDYMQRNYDSSTPDYDVNQAMISLRYSY